MAERRKKQTNPFDVNLKAGAKQDLVDWLCSEITGALEARGGLLGADRTGGDLEYAYTLYEQGRTRGSNDTRLSTDRQYADGADLTSYLGTQYVDALTSRAVKTIFTEPICIVEGIGESAARAPIVEEYHQWKAEQERLQAHFARAIRMALIERRAAIEVYEGSRLRRVRKTMRVQVQTIPDPETGQPLLDYDDEGNPRLMTDAMGRFVEVTEENPEAPVAEVVVESWDRIRTGPQYRVLSNREFLILPGHATQREDMWGWAKRFYKRIPELEERVKEGVYDKDAVDELGAVSDRQPGDRDTARDTEIAPQTTEATTEKELWEITFLKDLDNDGFEEWYIATVSVIDRQILRLQRDDLDQQRFILLVPFTRTDTELDGYSVILDKLLTIIEEHTAMRNMVADRSALVTGAPIKRAEGAAWKPWEIPFGPRAVIPVNRMDEVDAMQIPDVPPSALRLLDLPGEAAERVIGMNDASLGVNPQQDRTLGEVRMVAGYSEIRVEEILMNLRESIEDLYQVRHAIYVRLLEEKGEDGEAAPKDVNVGLERRLAQMGEDVSFGGVFTAEALRGNFRFKPRGSVESADLNIQRSDFNEFLKALAGFSQANQYVQAMLNTPMAAQAIMEQGLRVYRFPDRQAILGSATQTMQMPQPMAGVQPGQPGGMPPQGMPPGSPQMGIPGGMGPMAEGGMSPLVSQIVEGAMAGVNG